MPALEPLLPSLYPKTVCNIGRATGGTKYFIVEQESYQGLPPLNCSKQDYDIMKSWGF